MSLFQKIEPGNWQYGNKYTAPSNGYVLGAIKADADTNRITLGYAWCNGAYAYVTGGSSAMFGANGAMGRAVNAQSCLLPVFNGNFFYIGQEQATGASSSVEFWWISESPQQVGAHARSTDAGDSDFVPPPLPGSDPGKATNHEAFVAILERALGKPLAPDVKKDLLALGPFL